MKNDKKITIGLSLIALLGVITSIYVFVQTPVLEQKLLDKQRDKTSIDTYVSSSPTNIVTNEKAQEMFDEEVPLPEGVFATYRTPEGFEMVSRSKGWNTDKLIALYEELKLNKHGEEFELLFQVIVYGEDGGEYAGTQSSKKEVISFVPKFPALAENITIDYFQERSTIKLYNGDKYDTVQKVARTLSHEYGHHFTFYYWFNDSLEINDYIKTREIPEDKVLYDWSDPNYMRDHHWYAIEIAAEDYVQIMGSPMTKTHSDYKDIRELLHGGKHPDVWDASNGYPQENLMIPLAYEVEGLYDLFNSCIADEYEPAPELPTRVEMNISISKGYSSHNSVSGKLNFTHYKITWDDAYKAYGATYTLVYYGENGDYCSYPIKKVESGTQNIAYVGTVSRESSSRIHWYYDDIDKGTKTFVVVVSFPNGTIRLSNPKTYTFG